MNERELKAAVPGADIKQIAMATRNFPGDADGIQLEDGIDEATLAVKRTKKPQLEILSNETPAHLKTFSTSHS